MYRELFPYAEERRAMAFGYGERPPLQRVDVPEEERTPSPTVDEALGSVAVSPEVEG